MTADQRGDVASILDAEGLGDLVAALITRGYTVIGPTLRGNAIILAELESADDLPSGWGVDTAPGHYRVRPRPDAARFGHSAGPQSWKQFLHPPRQQVWSGSVDGRSDDGPQQAAPPYAFLGVRGCDLAAIAILDRVLGRGAHPDSAYAARRRQIFVVAVDCTEPGGLCFCASAGTGPKAGPGYDLALTELTAGQECTYLARVGSAAGAELLDAVPHRVAGSDVTAWGEAAVEAAAQKMGRQLPSCDLRELLSRSRESPHWDEVAGRCLTCGNCTMVCPTCFCTSTEDVSDLAGHHAQRWLNWASCFELDFSLLHEGPVRQSGSARYRQWLTHKLGTWHDQFGSSGCVGCGRCIAWCPTGIDITAELATLASTNGGQA